MVEPATSTGQGVATSTGAHRPRRGRRAVAVAVVAIVAIVGGLAIRQAGRSNPSPALASPLGGPPLIAVVEPTGGIATVDAAGRRTMLVSEPGVHFGFPAWSPDGTRIAAVRDGPDDAAVSIFPVSRGDPGSGSSASAAAASPATVVYRSADVPPFYLYWAPDGRRVSFLASEADEISLRVAPVDGSAPLDGTGPGGVLRRGAPLYFEWIGADRLLLHVGTGADAFLGEVGLDGAVLAPALSGTGEFRPAVVDGGGRYVAFVRGQPPDAAIVVAARDGSSEQAIPVFGPAAIVFDPAGSTLASIGAGQTPPAALAFPVGPLRLIEPASGAVRMLLDGAVIGFFWSPDGRTIAALRLQPGRGTPVAAAESPSAEPALPADPQLHLVFLDVADGAVRSDRVVVLTSRFVNQLLPYFDQYALSHRVWAPDSRSIVLPLVDPAGRDRLFVLPADGSDGPPAIDAEIGFWSP